MEPCIECKLVLINDSFKTSDTSRMVLQRVHPDNNVAYSSSAASDIMFSLSTGSIGFLLCCGQIREDMNELLKKMDISMRRSYVILTGVDENLWMKAQVELQGEKMQLLTAKDSEQGADFIIRIVLSLSDERRAVAQAEYFKRERDSQLYTSTANRVYQQMLNDQRFIGLRSEDEVKIIMSKFPNVQQFLCIPLEEIMRVIIETKGAIESDTLERIQLFRNPHDIQN